MARPPDFPAAVDFDVEKGDQPMTTGYLGGLVALIVPMVLAYWIGIDDWNTYIYGLVIYLFVMAAFLAWLDYTVRRKTLKKFTRPPRSAKEVLKPAFWRWLGWVILLAAGWVVYNVLVHYQNQWYAIFRITYENVFLGWICFGFPYYVWTLSTRYGLKWDKKDPAIVVLLVIRRGWRNVRSGKPWRTGLSPFFIPRLSRVVWLGLAVKFFFLPLMTTFFFMNGKEVGLHLHKILVQIDNPHAWSFQFHDTAAILFRFTYHSLFMVDVTIATLGYAVTSRWLDNGVRSVEPTTLGWVSCLLCYKPFNDLASWYLRWPGSQLDGLEDGGFKLFLMAMILFLTFIYVVATLAFGLSFSNLTHRGIFTRGPYRYVRHPAYISKSLVWWLEYLPSFVSLQAAFFMLAWNGIYFTRAMTEERHLSADPKYRLYKQRVKWRFIPGIY